MPLMLRRRVRGVEAQGSGLARGRSTLRRAPGRQAYDGGVAQRTGLIVSLAAIAVGVALLFLVDPLNDAASAALRGDTEELRSELRGLGGWGVAVLAFVILAHAVIWYPAEIPTAAAGFVYGFALGIPMVLGLWLISAVATYYLGRYAGRPLLFKLAGRRRFERAEAAVLRGGVPFLLSARLIPLVPYSLVGYVAGAAGVPVWRFTWTTAIGSAPLLIAFVALGSRLEELSLTDPVLWLILAPLLVLGVVAHPIAKRMKAAEQRATDPAAREPAG